MALGRNRIDGNVSPNFVRRASWNPGKPTARSSLFRFGNRNFVDGQLGRGYTVGSAMPMPGNTKGGSITVPLTSCFSGLD